MSEEKKTLQEWMDIYEQKTNEKVELGDGFHLFFLAEKGFCKVALNDKDKVLFVKEVCGNGRFWRKFILELAEHYKVEKMATFLIRKVTWTVRLFGGKILEEKDGVYIAEMPNGHRLEAYPYDNKRYFVVEYLL